MECAEDRPQQHVLVDRAKDTLSAASRMLRRRFPQSAHFMASKRFWTQCVPNQDADVAMTFPPGTSETTLLFFRAKLESVFGLLCSVNHINIMHEGKTAQDCFVIHVTATFQGFLSGLEQLQVSKRLREDLGGGWKEFTLAEAHNFHNVEELTAFLSSQERQAILAYLINGIRAEKGDAVEHIHFREGEAIVPSSLSAKVLLRVFPVHEKPLLQSLRRSWVRSLFARQPFDDISAYFGLKIAFYFAWLGHYTTALCIPAAVGAFVWFFMTGRAEFLEDLSFVLFAFFNVLWATLYLESWKRRSAELAFQWGTSDMRTEMLEEPRPTFKGEEERVSEITGKPEPFYPEWRRNAFRYLITAPVIFVCLLGVFAVVIAILEFQQHWDVVIEREGYFGFLRFLPKVLLAVVIPVMDGAYSKVALWLNNMENYRNAAQFENGLIIKLTLFQFVNSFLALFYTAFYLQDMDKLRELLATLLITRQVIGNLKESVVPYLKTQLQLAKMCSDVLGVVDPAPSPSSCDTDECDVDKKSDEPSRESEAGVGQVQIESSAIPYEGTFEDYLEMLIQFGYVTLFSCAYPLAGFWALANNVWEIRGDAFKLCFVHQRPFGHRANSIGIWQTAMEAMGVIGVMVNCALIGLSGQVDRMFPDITATQTIILIAALEHVMLLLKALLSYAIPDVPRWVETEMAKLEHRRRQIDRLSALGSVPSQDSVGTHDREAQTDNVSNDRESASTAEESTDDNADIRSNASRTLDKETEDFLKAVSRSTTDIFHKASNPQQVILQRASLTASSTDVSVSVVTQQQTQQQRLSPYHRSQSVKEEEREPSPSLRKRSCPASTAGGASLPTIVSVGTIHEDQVATSLAAAISSHDTRQLEAIMAEEAQASLKSKKKLSKRMASDTDLWFSIKTLGGLKARHAAESGAVGAPGIIVNHGIEMPPLMEVPPTSSTASSKAVSGPTPVEHRHLDQEEFNRRLKAKRAIFSKGKSLSLASFRKLPSALHQLPSALHHLPKHGPLSAHTVTAAIGRTLPDFIVTSPSENTAVKDEEYLRKNPVKGELDAMTLESLIDVNDVVKAGNANSGTRNRRKS